MKGSEPVIEDGESRVELAPYELRVEVTQKRLLLPGCPLYRSDSCVLSLLRLGVSKYSIKACNMFLLLPRQCVALS